MCKKLDIPYFMAQVMLLGVSTTQLRATSDRPLRISRPQAQSAIAFKSAERKALSPEIKIWYKTLEKAILKASMESAEKLKSIGQDLRRGKIPVGGVKA